MRDRKTLNFTVILALTLALLFSLLVNYMPPVHAQLPSFTFDPCANPGTAKSSTFANITTATTTQLVALVAGKQIFVCGISLDLTSTTASTAIFEYGTGASCGTGTTVLTHTYTNSTLVNAYKVFGGALETVLTTAAGNAFCVLTTVGTSPSIGVTITFVQQ